MADRVKSTLRPFVHALFRHTERPRLMLRSARYSLAYQLDRGRPQSLRAAFESGLPIGRSPGRSRQSVMLVISTLEADPRVEREARALAAEGWHVHVVFPETPGWRAAGVEWGQGVTFQPVPPSARHFADVAPGFYGAELFRAAVRHHPFAFHAHDLNTAYIGLAAARLTGSHLVCDFHEWFSENASYDLTTKSYVPHSAHTKSIMQWLEREALSNSSAVVTVCQSIAEALSSELGNGRHVAVVRNIPSFGATPTTAYLPLKQQIAVSDERFVLIYQGGVGPSRNLEPVIKALAMANRCTLVVRGPSLSAFEGQYRQIAERSAVADRLVLLPPVPSRDVVAAARGADAGIYTVKGVGRNFILALPNKVFEYLAAGLPVLVPNYPEVAKLVRDHNVGLAFDPDDPVSIAGAINRLIDEQDLFRELQANVPRALLDLDADREWQKVSEIYERLWSQVTPRDGARAGPARSESGA